MNVIYVHVYITCGHIELLDMFLVLVSNTTGTCTCIVRPQTLYNQSKNHLNLLQVPCITVHLYKKHISQHIAIL